LQNDHHQKWFTYVGRRPSFGKRPFLEEKHEGKEARVREACEARMEGRHKMIRVRVFEEYLNG
jgi:hypothetical protein